LVWLNFPTAYSFVMISPNLYAIWVFLLMNLSQDLTLVLLRYFGTLGDGYSLKGSNKKPSRHTSVFWVDTGFLLLHLSCAGLIRTVASIFAAISFHGKSRALIESNAKFRYLKNGPVKGLCGRCLSVCCPLPSKVFVWGGVEIFRF
jgi:hypothetical protein